MEHNLGICDACIEYIGAGARFERGSDRDAAPVCAGCSKPGIHDAFRVEGYLGDPNCSDCLSMTHCETHHKVEGLYPMVKS